MPKVSRALRGVFHVNEHADIVFFKPMLFVRPNTAQGLWQETHGAELVGNFAAGGEKPFRLDAAAVVMPGG